jgi:MFS family permease
VVGLFGGRLIDSVDRRRLVLGATGAPHLRAPAARPGPAAGGILGTAISGPVSHVVLSTPSLSAVIGGASSVAGTALLALAVPALRRYERQPTVTSTTSAR